MRFRYNNLTKAVAYNHEVLEDVLQRESSEVKRVMVEPAKLPQSRDEAGSFFERTMGQSQ